jgi:hypothetical protein
MAQDTCPKCGNPRQAGAVDCPWCGVVYAKAGPLPARAAAAAPAGGAGVTGTGAVPVSPRVEPTRPPRAVESHGPPPAAQDVYSGPDPSASGVYGGDDVYGGADVYTGPESRGSGAGGRSPAGRPGAPPSGSDDPPTPAHVDTPFTRAMPLSLLVAGLLYLLAQTFLTQNVANGVSGTPAAYAEFRLLTGLDAPEGQRDGTVLTIAGRKIVLLDEQAEGEPETDDVELSVFAYSEGSLAGNRSPEELLTMVEGVLGRLVDAAAADSEAASNGVKMSWWRVSERSYHLGSEPATLRQLALGAARGDERFEGMRIACIATRGRDGRPLLFGVAGPGPKVTRVLRPYLRSLSR